MPKGRHVGKCLETHKRSFRLIEPGDATRVVPHERVAQFGKNSQFVANVSHDGDFWTTAMPKTNGIESLTFLVERFKPRWLAAHTMLRVEFAEPLVLYSQTSPSKAPVKLKSIILSVEALAFQGGPSFGPISTLGQGFALATRLQSLEDRIAQAITEEKNLVRQYRLAFTNAEKDLFWQTLLEAVHDPDMKDMYNLLNRNCMNVLFQGIDVVLGRARKLFNRIASFYPVNTKSALAARGILENESLKTLNQEIELAAKEAKGVACPMNLLPESDTIVRASQFGP